MKQVKKHTLKWKIDQNILTQKKKLMSLKKNKFVYFKEQTLYILCVNNENEAHGKWEEGDKKGTCCWKHEIIF